MEEFCGPGMQYSQGSQDIIGQGMDATAMACTTRCYPYDNTIVLGEYLGVSDTRDLCAHLETVNAESDVTVDGSKVIDIDTSALQLLAALAIQLRNNGRRLHWTSPSNNLLTMANLSGLTAQLGLDMS
jgi:ABC-type transporter Mla MlaB component